MFIIMTGRVTKADYIVKINNHFALTGQRLSNLSKATLPILKKLVEKYNIKIDETEIQEEKRRNKKLADEKKEEERKEKEARDKKWAAAQAIHQTTIECRKNEWQDLTEDQQDDVLCFIVLKEQNEWHNNYWTHKEHNKAVVRSTDAMEAYMRKSGKIVERTGLNTLNANGVIVCNEHIYEPFNWDNSYSQLKKELDFDIIDPLKMLELIRIQRENER